MPGSFESGNWNEYNLNPLTRINWRASLVPAAAVIPAPIAYIKVVAVKKLVVGFLAERRSAARVCTGRSAILRGNVSGIKLSCRDSIVYCEKIRVFKAGLALNTLAWNNKIGLGLFCWFADSR